MSRINMLALDAARRFAETMLYWRNHLRARDVQQYLGVSERTARTLIHDWRSEGLLPPYRASGARRRLTPPPEFDPGAEVTDPNTALSLLLSAGATPGNPFATVALSGGGYDLALSAPIATSALRNLVVACLDRHPVWLLYAAKVGRQEFVFHPSALVRSRGRFHLRGFRSHGCRGPGPALDDRFVDVVPARAIEAQPAEQIAMVGLEDDVDWNDFETRTYLLSDALTDDERLCYEHEYGIAEKGFLKVTKRRALMPYVAQELAERRCWRIDGSWVRVWAMGDTEEQVGATSRRSRP